MVGTAMARLPPCSLKVTVQSSGDAGRVTCVRKAARILSGSMRETRRKLILALALAGITVLKPSPV